MQALRSRRSSASKKSERPIARYYALEAADGVIVQPWLGSVLYHTAGNSPASRLLLLLLLLIRSFFLSLFSSSSLLLFLDDGIVVVLLSHSRRISRTTYRESSLASTFLTPLATTELLGESAHTSAKCAAAACLPARGLSPPFPRLRFYLLTLRHSRTHLHMHMRPCRNSNGDTNYRHLHASA